jgi:hypothetical protein
MIVREFNSLVTSTGRSPGKQQQQQQQQRKFKVKLHQRSNGLKNCEIHILLNRPRTFL